MIFGITGTLAELFKKVNGSKFSYNEINKYNLYVYEGYKAKFIP